MFTADLVIISAFLIDEFGSTPPEHWNARLGPFVVGYDKWWDLEVGSRAIGEDFLPVLGHGIEQIEAMATDEGLRDALLRLAMEDRRGLSPTMQEWTAALIREVGPGAWATT
jgi:hypothetical protein